MGRYRKITSTYINKSFHQQTTNGSIWERNWVTIGERHALEPGKKSYYGEYNFLFTDNTNLLYRKKHNYGKWVAHLTYDDVKNSKPGVNEVDVSWESDDIRSYAYYGSSVELIEKSIENILNNFPARIETSDEKVYLPNEFGGLVETDEYWLSNQFNIDLYSTDINRFPQNVSPLRFMTASWNSYVIQFIDNEGNVTNEFPISGYEVTNSTESLDQRHDGTGSDWTYVKYCGEFYKWNDEIGKYERIEIKDTLNYFVACDEYIRYKDKYYEWNEDEPSNYHEIVICDACVKDYDKLFDITIYINGSGSDSGSVDSIDLSGYKVGTDIMFATEARNFRIQPKEEYIEDFFNTLYGFEKQLLNRRTNPLYRNKFIKPVETDFGVMMKYFEYIWPSNDYCIDISSPEYTNFISSLLDLAQVMDAYSTNNMLGRMTHEAMKNFDWTYRREYNEGDDEDNIEGGQRLEDIILVYGRQFDELKRYIDGIGLVNTITYNRYNNLDDAEISDKNELRGWEITSVIWQPYIYIEIDRTEIPEDANVVLYTELPTVITGNSPEYIQVNCEPPLYYMRTTDDPSSINMSDDYVYGGDEYDTPWIDKINPWIEMNSQGYAYVLIGSNIPRTTECSNLNVPQYWNNTNTFNILPTIVTSDSPEYIRIYDNTVGYWYYQKVSIFDNSDYLHDKWYGAVNKNIFTPIEMDIEYQRRLFLSTFDIWRTKGTQHGIDMVMSMFGFGREDSESNSDYTLTEQYYTFMPQRADEKVWYYMQLFGDDITCIYEGPSGVVWDDTNTFDTLPQNPTENNTDYPIYIRVGDDTYGYSYYKKLGTNLTDLITELNENKNSIDINPNTIFRGTPLNDIYIGNDKYIIPYYSQNKIYDGNIYFQMKGGWAKGSTNPENHYDYKETMSYLRSVSSISELLTLVSFDLEDGDIYYVASLYDYSNYSDTIPQHLSHYFKVIDKYNPQDFSSWRMIPMSGDIVYDNYIPTDEYITHEDYLHAKYLDEIQTKNIGNNPHVGFGEYDMGKEYIDNMVLPYKVSIENDLFNSVEYSDIAQHIKYPHERIFSNDKIKNLIGENSTDLVGYTNSKVLIMHNNIDNDLYKRYFTDVILEYLLQVIPSTTILILDNFDYGDKFNGEYCHIDVLAEPDGYGIAYRSGDYVKCNNITITAVPNEGYRFLYWTDSNDNIVGYQTSEPLTVLGDETYTAHFARHCMANTGVNIAICNPSFACNDSNCQVDFGCLNSDYNGTNEE